MQIRRAEPADEEVLASIRRSAILALAVPAMSREQAEQWATRAAADRIARAIRDHDVWVAVEGTALGWVEVDRDRVAALYVSPSRARCGFPPRLTPGVSQTTMTISMPILKIALLQMVSSRRNLDANLRKGEDFCRRAAAAGAHIALFPEMWSIGYDGFDPDNPDDREAWLALAVTRNAPFVQHFRQLAAELRMAIGITYLERWSDAPRNTFTLFDYQGDEILTYAKVHLCPWDPPDNACTPGTEFAVAPIHTPAGPVRVGCMICFDREFPEAARMLMLNGAELILTPNACELAAPESEDEFGDVRLVQFRSRAFENLVAVAMTNYAAPQNDGQSVAFNPDGTLIVQAGSAEEIVFAEIDLERLRALRQREVGRYATRCPEKYGAISSPHNPRPLVHGVVEEHKAG